MRLYIASSCRKPHLHMMPNVACNCGLSFDCDIGAQCRHCEAELCGVGNDNELVWVPREREDFEMFAVVRDSLFVRSFSVETEAREFVRYLRMMGVKERVECRRSIFLH